MKGRVKEKNEENDELCGSYRSIYISSFSFFNVLQDVCLRSFSLAASMVLGGLGLRLRVSAIHNSLTILVQSLVEVGSKEFVKMGFDGWFKMCFNGSHLNF